MEPWNKGQTKDTHQGVMKISRSLALRPRSNFWSWQQKNKPMYAVLKHGKDLAELYGTLLGDGCIELLARTEKITISFNRKEQKHLQHIARLLERIFQKKPRIRVRRYSQCDDLYLYQKLLSKRLHFPTEKKLSHQLRIPTWVHDNKIYQKHCLKGLFETDGNLSIDKKNYTTVIKFTNHSQSLLNEVFASLAKLGYHPQRRRYDVRLARHKEVASFVQLIQFRQY